MANLSRKAAIVGVAETAQMGKKVENANSVALMAEAARKAIQDAGLTNRDVDGVLVQSGGSGPALNLSVVVAEYLGIQTAFAGTLGIGGASAVGAIGTAAAALAAGLCHTVVFTHARGTGAPVGTGDPRRRSEAVARTASLTHPQFEHPYGPLLPTLYAWVAARHMHEYGTTMEQLAAIAVVTRRHANLTERAQQRGEITIQQVLNSRMITWPLHLLDCSLISEGGAAYVITSAERAQDLRWRPTWILGVGQGHTHEFMTQAPNLTSFGQVEAGRRAFGMAGVQRSDIDVAEIYDSFTITVLVDMEDLGFCAKGEGGAFVGDGARIDLGGQLPVNTHGGLLSYAHIDGPIHVVEAVRQLRGGCGARQVEGARLALVSGSGGFMSTKSCAILGRD
ncbi:MAG: hypothetical protein HY690_03100 [Chloroflexi bacterium]|nr:hypothetical protein [Chloroflexota bacterium]